MYVIDAEIAKATLKKLEGGFFLYLTPISPGG